MKYSRFEILAMAVVICAVVGTIFAISSTSSRVADIIGQAMIVVALFGGLHYGRRGALISFLIATGIYAVFAFGFRGDVGLGTAAELFAIRTLVFAIVAFVAGEINVRLKYLFTKLEHNDYVDDITSLYNARYLSQLIERHISDFDRYGNRFSMTSFTVNPELLQPLKKKVKEKFIKDLGNSVIRGNIRGADEASRLEGTTFAVLFPNTDLDGATYATTRIKGKVVSYLDRHGLDTESECPVKTEILEYPKDKDAVEIKAGDLKGS